MNRLGRLYLGAMVVLLLLGFALGAQKLNADNLWLDELYSLSNMGVFEQPFSLPEVVHSLTEHSPNHVPLYFFLGAQWARLVGWSQLPMRYLSLLFGILFIAWTYRFAADALDRATAVLAATLVTTSGFILMYFHEIRMYTLLLLLLLMHAWLYWRLCAKATASGREWLLFVLTAIAQLYTHVFSVFALIGFGLHHLVFARRILRWRGILLAWIISALAFLPYAPGYLRGAMAERTIASLQDSALSAPQLAVELAHIMVNGLEPLWLPILALAMLALWKQRWSADENAYRMLVGAGKFALKLPSPMPWGGAGGGVRKRNSSTSRHSPPPDFCLLRILVVCAGIVLSLMLFNEVFPLIDRLRFRFFLAAVPFFAILCAYILWQPGRSRIVAAPFLLVWIAGGLHIHGLGDSWRYSGRNTLFVDIPPLHKFANSLQQSRNKLDLVVGFSQSKFVDWPLRHGKSIADYYFGAILNLDHAFFIDPLTDADLRISIDEQLDDHPYLLLAYEPAERSPLYDQVTAVLEAEYAACGIVVDEADLSARRYVDKALTCDRPYQPIHYENGIKIVDKFGGYDAVRQSVRVLTGWEVAAESQLDDYNVSIQIITPDWQKVGQAPDRHLHDDVLKWYVVEIPTDALSPGAYQVVIILYDRHSKAKVSGVDQSTGETGNILPILEFSVQR